jgi:hypothetical protein
MLPDMRRASRWSCSPSARSSTSPSRRRATARRRWSRPWRSSASAVRPPMRPSSRRCRSASTCCWTRSASLPTDVGRIVNKFLTEHFTSYVDYDFTAKLEDELDAVSRGEEDWIPLLEQFWKPFKDRIDHTQENVERKDVTQETHRREVPGMRRPALQAPRAQRALHRLHQLPGVQLHPQPGRGQGREGGAADRRGPQLPGVRLRAVHQARPLRQVHRLHRLPQVQAHRAAGEARGHRRRACPKCKKGTPA